MSDGQALPDRGLPFWQLPIMLGARDAVKLVETERHAQLLGGGQATDLFVAAVHGPCRRCRSRRQTVFNKQMRRADEGPTEVVTCRDCGHTTRRAA